MTLLSVHSLARSYCVLQEIDFSEKHCASDCSSAVANGLVAQLFVHTAPILPVESGWHTECWES